MRLNESTPSVILSTANARGGLELTFDVDTAAPSRVSDVWTTAGWSIQFVYLAPHQTLELPGGRHYIKVILGKLENLGRGCFAENFAIRSTRIESNQVLSGPGGLLFALFTESSDVPTNIHDMAQCEFSGPSSEHLNWQSFEDKFGHVMEYFIGLDNHMANGFHLLNHQGEEIVYVNFWTCGKGGDVSTHNHAQAPSEMSPAFVEVHLVLNNGTGLSGMYETDGPQASERQRHSMQRGDEHGPYFEHKDGSPCLHENGAVIYPWHGWESGTDDQDQQSYDFVAAFEINPKFASL
jgi:hypothetical protein